MSPEAANICIINDKRSTRESTSQLLELFGHRVTLTAATLQEALGSIPFFKGLGIQVALVDGNLTEGDISGTDGQVITAAIKELAPQVKTIGYSTSGYVEGVDVNYDFRKNTPEDLVKFVSEL